MNNNNKISILAALCACLILSGCGGGENPGSSSAPANNGSSSSSTGGSSSSAGPPLVLQPPIPEEVVVVAIDSGADSGTQFGDIFYQADDYFDGGSISTTGDTIAGTVDDGIYQTERFGEYSYEVPVTNGSYSVLLQFAEIFNTSAGERSFSIGIEGNEEMFEVDLFSLVGHDGAFEFVVYDVEVNDGSLTIDLITHVDNATISGFVIFSDDGGQLN